MEKIDKFRLFLLQEGNKPSSISLKLKQIDRLLKHSPSFEKEGFDRYFLELKTNGNITSYINALVIVLHQWGKCFNIKNLATYPRFKGNNSTFIRSTLSDEEIEQLINLPYYGTQGGLYLKRYDMWTVFFSILAYTGARPIEAAQLTINDIDFGRNVFILRYTKTNIPREVPISFVIKDKIQDYIKSIRTNYLFPNYMKTKTIPYVNGFSWRYPFDERIKRLGIKRTNLTVYSLRHSFITRQADEDVSIFKIQQLVGHRQLETTARYVHLSIKALQNTITNDRLAKRHRSGIEILRDIADYILKIEKEYIDSISVNVSKSKDERKMLIKLEVK